MHNWRESLIKYIKLPGIRSLHNFVVVTSLTTGDAAVCVRDYCYEGAVRDAPIGLATGHTASENAFPNQSYSQSGSLRPLSSTKVIQMMDNFIPSERRMSLS